MYVFRVTVSRKHTKLNGFCEFFGVGGTKALVRISVRNGGSRNYNSKNKRNSGSKNGNKRQYTPKKPRIEADKDEQLKVSMNFLEGLVKSFGLEGSVEGLIEDENLVVKITGQQTEALVGDKGFIIYLLAFHFLK